MKRIQTILPIVFLLLSCTSQPDTSVPVEELTAPEEDTVKKTETVDQNQEETRLPNIWDSVNFKADWFMDGLKANRDLSQMPVDFAEFYKQFISDSVFQANHISYKTLIGVLGECDTTIRFNQQNWEFTNWDFTEFFDGKNDDYYEGWDNTFYYSTDRFYYQFNLEEVGWIYKTGFEKIGDQWQLTLYYVNAC